MTKASEKTEKKFLRAPEYKAPHMLQHKGTTVGFIFIELLPEFNTTTKALKSPFYI